MKAPVIDDPNSTSLRQRLAGPRDPNAFRAAVDTAGIMATIRQALGAAGLDPSSGPMKGVTDTIEQAFVAAGLQRVPDVPGRAAGVTFDGIARDVSRPAGATLHLVPRADLEATVVEPQTTGEGKAPAAFLARSFTNAAGTRPYKLYVPRGYAHDNGAPRPLVVMLHGCTQSPDDFARGTRMNSLADEHGFLVVYPAQPASANGARCWNWFRVSDQSRDSGEPSLIADITRDVASSYRVDRRRIYVAGLSAGAAMAVVLGAVYPDLFAAVGAHSGLAFGAAHDLPSAFDAMRRGRAPAAAGPTPPLAVPVIVFHGDADATVNVRNAEAIVGHAAASLGGEAPLDRREHAGTAPGGRAWRRVDYVDRSNRVAAEHWVIEGGGHAWSGGSAQGSFTDPRGPDASAEMIRFFLAQTLAGTS